MSASQTNYISMQNQHNCNQNVQQIAENLPEQRPDNQESEREHPRSDGSNVLSRSLTNTQS